MARDTLGYQYTGDEDTSRMPDNKVEDEDIVEMLAGYSRIYHRTLLAQSPSTPRLDRRIRYVVETADLEY
jgi:hypothetical protein